MKLETLQLLKAADDSIQIEAPDEFNWSAAMSRVKSLIPTLNEIVSRSFELDEYVQDASYFAELSLQTLDEQPGQREIELAVYFSSFGNLFTIWSEANAGLASDIEDKIRATVEAHGFKYVEASSLNEPYRGNNPYFQGSNWWHRYFGYV